MPTISKEEISGLAKVFSLYVKFPEKDGLKLKSLKKTMMRGNKMMAKLGKEFDEKYRPYKASNMDLHD